MARPVRVCVLCSGSASSLRWLRENDPNYGKLYEVVGAFSSVRHASGLDYAEEHGISTAYQDYEHWCEFWGYNTKDLDKRQLYFERVLELVMEWKPDAIMLSGFMLLITEPLLSCFAGRMLNVHPAYLDFLDGQGSRTYTGLNVVARAMAAGDPTGATVHIATAEPDMGPIVAMSDSLPYEPDDDPDEHQELMKTECDGPAYQAALKKLIAAGWPWKPWRPE